MNEIEPLEENVQLIQSANREPIAPWWHCGLLVAIIVAASAFGSMHSAKSSMASYHLANYGVTLVWEWALAGLAYWGIRLRKTPLRAILGSVAAAAKSSSSMWQPPGSSGFFLS